MQIYYLNSNISLICYSIYSQVGTASIYFVDPSNDLGITFHIQDYRSLAMKFPRVESFSTGTTSNGLKFSSTETIAFYSNVSKCMQLGLSLYSE
jgi:hypothetical protein